MVCICNDLPHVVGFVVGKMFCGGCLVCPLSVAVDKGRCHMTAVFIRPGQPVKWLLLMAVIHVDVCVENRHKWHICE